MKADLLEIRTIEPYPEDCEKTVEQARRETEAGFEPEVATAALDMAPYRTVFLGFPIPLVSSGRVCASHRHICLNHEPFRHQAAAPAGSHELDR